MSVEPPQTLENQGEHSNNQGNALLNFIVKLTKKTPPQKKIQGKEGQGSFFLQCQWEQFCVRPGSP